MPCIRRNRAGNIGRICQCHFGCSFRDCVVGDGTPCPGVDVLEDPAFLTFTGQQALDLRRLEVVVGKLPPELIGPYMASLMLQGLQRGQSARIAGTVETTEQDVVELERELDLLIQGDQHE